MIFHLTCRDQQAIEQDHQDGNPHHDPLRSTAPPGGVAESHQQKGDEDCYAHRSRFSCQSLPVNRRQATAARRSEEHTSELQSLMRNSYAVFCLKKKNTKNISAIISSTIKA